MAKYIEAFIFSSIGFPVLLYAYMKQSWYLVIALAVFVIAYDFFMKKKRKSQRNESEQDDIDK